MRLFAGITTMLMLIGLLAGLVSSLAITTRDLSFNSTDFNDTASISAKLAAATLPHFSPAHIFGTSYPPTNDKALEVSTDFSRDSEADLAKVKRLALGYKDALYLAYRVLTDYEARGIAGIPSFTKYFAEEDIDQVMQVFSNIKGGDSFGGPGTDVLSNIVWLNRDFAVDFGKGCRTGEVTTNAYLVPLLDSASLVPTAYTHMCDAGYALNDMDGAPEDICEQFDGKVSAKMQMIGGTMLHEYTHFSSIGAAACYGVDIIDRAYGPVKARTLSSSDQLSNADNYMWFALQHFWEDNCYVKFADPEGSSSWDTCCVQ